MTRLLVTLLLLSRFNSAQESHSAASATKPEAASDLPVWSTTLTQPNSYISAHGIRGFAGGYSEDGLEFWSFPLQLVSGYHLSFVLPKAPSISAITMLTSVEIDPLGVYPYRPAHRRPRLPFAGFLADSATRTQVTQSTEMPPS